MSATGPLYLRLLPNLLPCSEPTRCAKNGGAPSRQSSFHHVAYSRGASDDRRDHEPSFWQRSGEGLEEVYLGLRTSDGVPPDRLPADTVAAWTDAGWARTSPDRRLRLTPEGWLRLDALVASATA